METPLTARERADVIPTFNSDDDDFTPQHRSAEMDFAPLGASTLAAGNLDHLFANGMTHDEHLQRLLFGSNFAE